MNPFTSPAVGAGAPYQDAFALLTSDHEKVNDLFDEYQSALEAESDEQQELADLICQELELHAELEEEIFYPALSQHAELRSLVDEALREHDEVKITIQRLRALSAEDPEFASLMMELMEAVEHHVDEEESVIFSEAERHMDSAVLSDLAARLQERKRELSGSH